MKSSTDKFISQTIQEYRHGGKSSSWSSTFSKIHHRCKYLRRHSLSGPVCLYRNMNWWMKSFTLSRYILSLGFRFATSFWSVLPRKTKICTKQPTKIFGVWCSSFVRRWNLLYRIMRPMGYVQWCSFMYIWVIPVIGLANPPGWFRNVEVKSAEGRQRCRRKVGRFRELKSASIDNLTHEL